jgi:hypothetical protein
MAGPAPKNSGGCDINPEERLMHMLIPYVYLPRHEDPLFPEYTYGDTGARGRKLISALESGDFVFFHTTLRGSKHITAYYVVDRVMESARAAADPAIRAKYSNPHLKARPIKNASPRLADDAVLFGDPIRSRILPRALPFDRALAKKLSLNISFHPGKTDTQTIASATRAWRELTKRDVKTLLREINRWEAQFPRATLARSTEEVAEVLERDIEAYLALAPATLGKDLTLWDRQFPLADGRADLIFQDRHEGFLIVEVKLGQIGRDAVIQIRQYVKEFKRRTRNNVRGVLVCAGVLPAYQDEISKQKDLTVLTYGWRMHVQPWVRHA